MDVHAHWTPEAELGGAAGPVVSYSHGRQVGVSLRGRSFDSITGELARLDVLLEQAAARGVGRVVLAPWVATIPLTAPAAEADLICRRYNHSAVEALGEYGERVRGLAAVPLQTPRAAAAVLAEAMAGGMVGAELLPSAGGLWLGDHALLPFYEAAADLGAVLFVHPGVGTLGPPVLKEMYLWNVVGNPYETGLAAAHMVMTGVLERVPGLRVLLAHGGGALPAVAARMTRAWHQRPEARAHLATPPEVSLGLLHHDTVVHSRSTLRGLIDFAGADRVLLGSDHPFDMGLDDPVGDVVGLGLPEPEARAILGGNALRLFWGEDEGGDGGGSRVGISRDPAG